MIQRLIRLCLALILSVLPVLAEDFDADFLFSQQDGVFFYLEHGRIGLRSLTGVLIEARYDGAYPFEGDYAVVQMNGKEGVIKKNGEQILPCVYQSVHFTGAVFEVQMNDLYGLSDMDGNPLLQPCFGDMIFRGKYATVRDAEGRAGLIDDTGRTLIPCKWDMVYHPSDFWSVVIQDGRYNFASILHDGALMFEEMQVGVGHFSDGFAPVWEGADAVYLVDTSGDRYSSRLYQSIGGVFPEGGCFPARQGGKWGVVNTSKQFETPFEWDGMDDFSEGLAAVQTGRLWGYINCAGDVVIPPEYHAAYPFREGIAVVQPEPGKYQYIDNYGKRINGETYVEAERFSDGFAVVKLPGKAYYSVINQDGQTVLSAIQWDKLTNFGSKLFMAYTVSQENRMYFINLTGDVVSYIERSEKTY